MEEKLKELMQELGNAINESLSDSDRIAAAIGEIKRAGYDVFLVLEATIGFNKREDSSEAEPEDGEVVESEAAPPKLIQSPAQPIGARLHRPRTYEPGCRLSPDVDRPGPTFDTNEEA